MSEAEHTPEPWQCFEKAGDDSSGAIPVGNLDLPYVGLIRYSQNPKTSLKIAEANAERIVTCVNACAGINPESAPDLLAACEGLVKELTTFAAQHSDKEIDESLALAWSVASEAIAKAKGTER